MSACRACGSADGRPMDVSPPHGNKDKPGKGGKHYCTPEECDRSGWFCRACRTWSPFK